MTSFETRTASDFLQKLRDDQADFIASDCLCERHALNAVMTAYHLHEWVWGDFAKRRYDLYRAWRLSPTEYSGFKSYLIEKCPALADAEALTNGTKHFGTLIRTGKHEGAFQRNAFQDDAFDVPYLWIERGKEQQRAEAFIQELVDFWEGFFSEHAIG